MGLISSGVTGINAATLGLLTTEHNIANASTPGFNRQRIIQSTATPLFTGGGFIGQGTQVTTIQRAFNQYLSQQVSQSQTTASELQAYSSQISQIDNLLADSNAGLSPALQEFFRGVQQVAADPASIPARQAMMSSSQALVARFQSIEGRLTDIADGVNTQIGTAVEVINSYARQIADINQRIVLAQASASQPANDLLDQRDQILGELNKYVRVTSVEQRDGSFSVFIGTGQQLVVGTQVNTLDSRPSSADGERFSVGYLVGGVYQELPEFVFSGGQLGGLMRFRNESLDAAFNGLGQVAASLALTFNAQHAMGQDLLGNVSGDPQFAANFFTLGAPKTIADALNTGTGAVTAALVSPPPLNGNFYTNLSTSDYRLNYDGTNYTLTRLSDNTQWSNASLATLSTTVSASEGFTFSLSSGAIAANDSFLIRPMREMARNIGLNGTIVGDVRKIAAGFPVRTQALSTNTGDGRISSGEPISGQTPPTANTDITFVAATPRTTTSAAFTASDYTLAGAGAQFKLTDDSVTNLVISLSGADYTGNEIGLVAAINAQLTAAGSNTVASYSGGALVFTSGENGPTAVQPTLSAIGANLTADGLAGLTNAGGAAAALTNFSNGTVTVTTPAGVTTAYTITALTDQVPYTAGSTVDVVGVTGAYRFVLDGQPANGDVFRVGPNPGGVSDNRNMLRLGQLQTQNTSVGRSTTFQGAYAQLVSGNGNRTREAQVTQAAQESLLEQATAAREAQSGVNLDEEAANLIHFQQAYQAAAKVIDTASKLFDELLNIGR